MKAVVNKNLEKINTKNSSVYKTQKNFSQKLKKKIELKKTYSKDEMDIWP